VAATPTPTPTLTINDVTQAEGNSGTTNFTFTVSLSVPARTGGVSFTVNTQDGTTNPATAGSDYVAIVNGSGSIPENGTSTQVTVQVNGETATELNETFFVNITNITGAGAGDTQGLGTIQNDDVNLVLIHDVQGSTPTGTGNANSPRLGQVLSVRGIVTLLKSNGFFLQEEVSDNDSDPNTSEGIFVFTGATPIVAVGDQVTVTGTVTEFNGLTELSTSNGNVSVNTTGNGLPTAVTLTPTDLPANANYTQPQLEKYEGMRLLASSLTTVSPNNQFFEVYTVITGQPRPVREPGIEVNKPIPPDPTTSTPDPNVPRFDLNPERLLVDTNDRAGSTGETMTSNVVLTGVAGPLDYAFGSYRLIAEAPPTRSSNMSASPLPTPLANEFTVAGYNIENFNNNATQRAKAALTICNVMRQPDIIGVVEIFELTGLQALAAEVQTRCGVTYSAHLVEGDGTSGDADQDVGYLVKTSRVAVDSVTQERASETFIPPGSSTPAMLHDRPPLVLRGRVDPTGVNLPVITVVNHTRSFICIDADVDPAVAASSSCSNGAADGPRVREKRKKQAESIAGLLQELQTNNPTTSVIAVGDYNAFQFNNGYDDPISVMKGTPTPDDQIVVDQSPDLVNPNFYNLIDELPFAEQYSFNFDNTMQALDHHLVNTVARAHYTRIAIARVNSDYPDSPAAAYASNSTVPERNSDHDPVVSYYSLTTGQPAGTIIISEFRLRGTTDEDEFIELYNTTPSPVTVSTIDGSAGWSLVASDGAVRFTIPNNTVIPARGHYLGCNSDGYSLNAYPAGNGTTATCNAPYTDDIVVTDTPTPAAGGVALFNTANTANFTLGNRLDAAGYSLAPSLYREGSGIAGYPTAPGQYSHVRALNSGNPKDTGFNEADFVFIATQGAATFGANSDSSQLGAPGPENLSSPVLHTNDVKARLLDATVLNSSAPNRERNTTPYVDTVTPSSPSGGPPASDPYTLGTLVIRRRFVNNTGGNVTRLRFRLVDVTTLGSPYVSGGFTQADLRAISTSDTDPAVLVGVTSNDPGVCSTISPGATSCVVPVRPTKVEQPPTQSQGGGYNTTLSVDLSAAPIAPGGTVDVQFLLGVAQGGKFRFFANVEAVVTTPPPPPPSENSLKSPSSKTSITFGKH
jgi:predicted extracellular nuclease